MSPKIRWGVLGVAGIATKKVIPAMRGCSYACVVAIASRDRTKAERAANDLSLDKGYGSYEELLADPTIDAVYNPLPNHLHVPWSIKAAEAGKHVLCEKPISLSSEECRKLMAARDRSGVKIGEAFMVRTHPQWLRTRELIRAGHIGPLRSIVGFFSYYNADPANIRNIPAYGGGALMDIGCYPINIARWMFGEEPTEACGMIERDPAMATDRLTSAILNFPSGQAVFTCSTQLVPYQRMQFFGAKGRLEVEIPFNAPPDHACRVFTDDGRDILGSGIESEAFFGCNQYTVQGDAFSRAILDNKEVPVPLEDALNNMLAIEKILASAGR